MQPMVPWDRILQLLFQYGAARNLRVIRHEQICSRLARSGKPEDFERLVDIQLYWIWYDTLWPLLLYVPLGLGGLALLIWGAVRELPWWLYLPFAFGIGGAIATVAALVERAQRRRARALAQRWIEWAGAQRPSR
ncbi:hypothetical protein [Geochorda subterranea]|uniref:Uncharacterized protein n=1 Tax=Geochorda subterranea TaxID=3109564 RepID=A0ABZ1BMG3_9FIRM|nr:hypothetical protein [Limnochorda sp. LNt]WRP13773.1 hypothetical protein VLY81_10025 [Limnochorda sp. LNt]